jgi:hypothetical protein
MEFINHDPNFFQTSDDENDMAVDDDEDTAFEEEEEEDYDNEGLNLFLLLFPTPTGSNQSSNQYYFYRCKLESEKSSIKNDLCDHIYSPRNVAIYFSGSCSNFGETIY